MENRILIVEDEPGLSAFIKKGLEEEGYLTHQAFDGSMALRLLEQHTYALILLDVILPGGQSGYDLSQVIRKQLSIASPILILTALGSTDDIVTGLDVGADDYLTKPFKIKELLARIRALIRRGSLSGTIAHTKELALGDLTIDRESLLVHRSGKQIKLTTREFRLLEYLIRNQGRVVSRADILENVWDVQFDLGTNVVDVYINYLRNKIDKPFSTKLIHTIIGVGYQLKLD